jgi:hypothetical protein
LQKAELVKICDCIKTKLLSFLLKIKELYPDLISIELPGHEDKINQILKDTMYNINGNNNVLINNVNSPNASNYIELNNDVNELANFLKQYCAEEAINEIKKIPKNDPSKRNKIFDWLKSMPSKALEKIVLDSITTTVLKFYDLIS